MRFINLFLFLPLSEVQYQYFLLIIIILLIQIMKANQQIINQYKTIPSQFQLIINTLHLLNSYHAHLFKNTVQKHLDKFLKLANVSKIESLIKFRINAFSQKYINNGLEKVNQQCYELYRFIGNILYQLVGMGDAVQWFQIAYQHNQNKNELCKIIIEHYLPTNQIKALQYANKLQFINYDQDQLLNLKKFVIKFFLKDDYKIQEITKSCILSKSDQNQLYQRKNKLWINLIQRYNILLKFIISIQKHCYDQYLQLSANLFFLNRFQEAISLCQQLRRLNPSSAQIQLKLALRFTWLNDNQSAVGCCKHALRINPTFQKAYYMLIICLINLKNISQAKKYLTNLIKLNSNKSQVYWLSGLILFEQKDYKSAKMNYVKSIQINKNNHLAYQKLGDVLIKLNKISEAIITYKISIKIHPYTKTYNMLAYCYILQRDWSNAFQCFKSAINTNYQQDISYFNLAYLYNLCKNNQLKKQINKFMQNLRQIYKNNLIIQYNTNLFYKHSKHPTLDSQLQQMVSRMIPTKQEQFQSSIYGQLINNITYNYFNFTQQSSPKKDIQYTILMGIFWLIKNKQQNSNQIYNNLLRPHLQQTNQNIKQSFFSFFKQHISKQSTIMQSLTLQFILNRMISNNPSQTIECFMKILHFTPFSYECFSYQLRQSYQQKTSIIDQLCKIIENIFKQQGPLNPIQQRQMYQLQCFNFKNRQLQFNLIEFLQNMNFMYTFASIWSNTARNAYNQGHQRQIKRLLCKYFDYYIQEENNLLQLNNEMLEISNIKKSLLKSIEWNNEIQSRIEFHQLIEMIKGQQLQYINGVLNFMRLYETQADMIPLFIGVSSYIEEYFQEKYLINQLCKLIINSLSPYLFHYHYKGTIFDLCKIVLNFKRNKQFSLVKPFIDELFQTNNYKSKNQLIVNPKINARNQIYEQSDEQWSIDIQPYNQLKYFNVQNREDEQLSIQINKKSPSLSDQINFQQMAIYLQQEQHKDEYMIKKLQNENEIVQDSIIINIQRSHQNLNQRKNLNKQIQIIKKRSSQLHQSSQEKSYSLFVDQQESSSYQQYQFSSFQSKIYQANQYQNDVVRFLSTIRKNCNLPSSYKPNKSMRQSIFQNTNNIIFYLAANSSKFNHIAKHYIRRETILRRKDRIFLFLVQMGDSNYSNQSGQGSLAHYLWEIGLRYVLEWIISTAKGISQLEQLGIFHCDLQYRNTIKIGQIYKIIDFDMAFVVKRCNQFQGNQKAYKSTKKIVQIWLKSRTQQIRREQNFIRYIFSGIQDNEFIMKILNLKQNAKFQNSSVVDEIMSQLQIFMHKSHLAQFTSLINDIDGLLRKSFVQKLKQNKGHNSGLITNINKLIDKLEKGSIQYNFFCQQMQEIKKACQS